MKASFLFVGLCLIFSSCQEGPSESLEGLTMNQLEEIATSASQIEKADAYLQIATIYFSQGDKSNSRASARKALELNPELLDAHVIIGDLYMQSFDECAAWQSKIDDKAIFIAAYDQYKKAGYQKGMAEAKARFPSIEEIFSHGKEEGQSIAIGCWINMTISLQRRTQTKSVR